MTPKPWDGYGDSGSDSTYLRKIDGRLIYDKDVMGEPYCDKTLNVFTPDDLETSDG